MPGPSRDFGTFADTGDAGETAETLREIPWAAQRAPFGPGKALPGPQKERLSPRRPRRESFAMDIKHIAKLLVVKT
jgi:hypothetical protein